jgi:hypothetical protein
MANYFRCDTTFIKSSKERLYSTKPATDVVLPNGVFGFMGSYVSEEIRELLIPTADLIKNQVPVLVHNPEINYRQEVSTDNALGIYRNASGKVLRTFPLQQYDVVTLSEDYFDLTGKAGTSPVIAVGDMFALQANLVAGTQLKYSATAPVATANKVYFKVLKVANAYTPVFVGGDGQLFPQAYKNIDVEVIFA